MSTGVTGTVVNHVVRMNYQDMPAETVHEAKRSLLNWLGVAIGGAFHPAVEIVCQVANRFGGPQQATVLGRGMKVDLLFAALLNGLSSHVHDFDDTLLETVLHPSAPVFPAIFSYAEHRGLTGRAVLEAFILGAEVEARLARCLYPTHYLRGWHITGTVGVVGAAVAVGKLMGLDEMRLAYAVGLAATSPTGLREMFGTMTKSFHPGKAAMDGLLAAMLAEAGFTSSQESLEARRGFGYVLSDDPKFEYLLGGWGEQWEILKNSYKPFASGVVTHAAIDGVIRLRNLHAIAPEQVDRIDLEVHPLVLELTGKRNPTSGLEGKFSVYYCAAVALIDGQAGIRQFTDEKVRDPKVIALREKVHVRVNHDLEEDQAFVTITLNDGRVVKEHVHHATGSRDLPMTDEQLEHKFFSVTEGILPADKQGQVVQFVWGFEKVEDLSAFLTLCSR